MPVSIPQEIIFFLYSALYGAIFFFAYDILRCLRRAFLHNAFWIAVEDLIFWMAAGISLFLMVFDKNSGTYRSCFFLGLFLGMLVWYLLFDRLVLKVVTWVFLCLKKGASVIFGTPAAFLGKRGSWTLLFFRKKIKKAGRTFVKHLKKGGKLVKISNKR